MSDGLTAEQEAAWRYPDGFKTYVDDARQLRSTFILGAEFGAEREQARADAAEAKVRRLEAALDKIRAHEMTGQKVTGCVRCWAIADAALAAPTTEAVTG